MTQRNDTILPPNPSGLCQCGCGKPAPIAVKTDRKANSVKGHPVRFIVGHNASKGIVHENVNPSGICQCGCGQKTRIDKNTKFPRRFIDRHGLRKSFVLYLEVDRGFGTPCWEWQRARTSAGYGMKYEPGKHLYAHRWMYEQRVGEIGDGLELDHLCRNRCCVNPDHLEPVTHAENMRRSFIDRGLSQGEDDWR